MVLACAATGAPRTAAPAATATMAPRTDLICIQLLLFISGNECDPDTIRHDSLVLPPPVRAGASRPGRPLMYRAIRWFVRMAAIRRIRARPTAVRDGRIRCTARCPASARDWMRRGPTGSPPAADREPPARES